MIDWSLAERIGGFVAGDAPAEILDGDLIAFTADAVERVTAYTRLVPMREIPPPEAVGRRSWLAGNLASMRATLAPLDAKLADDNSLGGMGRALAGTLTGAELGVLTGYLAQRVLGQYELVLLDPATEPGDPGAGSASAPRAPERLLFVAPNLRAAALKLDVDEAQLVHWVTFHEVTHAVQFTSVPWLRDHLGGLLRQLLDSVDVKVDAGAIMRLPSVDDLRSLVDRVRDGGLITLVAGPARMALIDEMQAAMAVVEGHAEHVMDAVGAGALKDLDALRSALEERRREKPPAVKLLEKLMGLELKLRQYELGKHFCDEVVARGGIEALNRVWAGPDALPTLAELEAPERWLARI